MSSALNTYPPHHSSKRLRTFASCLPRCKFKHADRVSLIDQRHLILLTLLASQRRDPPIISAQFLQELRASSSRRRRRDEEENDVGAFYHIDTDHVFSFSPSICRTTSATHTSMCRDMLAGGPPTKSCTEKTTALTARSAPPQTHSPHSVFFFEFVLRCVSCLEYNFLVSSIRILLAPICKLPMRTFPDAPSLLLQDLNCSLRDVGALSCVEASETVAERFP